MVSINDRPIGSYVSLTRLNFQRTHWIQYNMAEIRHLENRHDVIFSAEGGLIRIKFRIAGTE